MVGGTPTITFSTAELLELEYEACRTDFWYWLANYGYIKDERAAVEIGPGIELWCNNPGDYQTQADYLQAYITGKWLITGKARQVGVSWLATQADVWEIMFGDPCRITIVAQSDDWSMVHLGRCRLVYNAQPEYLKRRKPVIGMNSKHEFAIGTPASYSVITAQPCTDVRGVSAKRVRLEELAFWPRSADPRSMMVAIVGAVGDGGGQVVINSTANGEGDEYHATWQGAQAGENEYMPCFMAWHLHPERDEAWYARTLARMGGSIAEMQQEYPATPEEMFLASGTKVFNRDNLIACFTTLQPLALAWAEPGWQVFVEPVPDARYVIGADPADAGGDACAADVFNADTGEQVAQLHSSDWEAWMFADHLAALGMRYNNALLVVERENHGHAVIGRLVDRHKYLNQYEHDDGRYGHPTNKATRPAMITTLANRYFERKLLLHSKRSYDESRLFAWIDGKPQAPSNAHDDCVLSQCKAVVGLDYVAASSYIPPAPVLVQY